MDIDVQNAQTCLPPRDAMGRPRCFNCNAYGHVARHCHRPRRNAQPRRQIQNAQITKVEAATLGAVLKNA